MDKRQPEIVPEVSDEQLVLEAAEGDEHAFAALFLRYEKVIELKAARFRHVGLGQDQRDFMQEGTIGFLSAVHTYRVDGGASFAYYASRCMENRMLSLYKRSAGQKHIPLNSFISLSGDDDLDILMKDVPQHTIIDPEAALIERERIETLMAGIRGSLSDMEYNVFTLYLRGMTYSEIAAALEKSVKSVDNAFQRIRRKL